MVGAPPDWCEIGRGRMKAPIVTITLCALTFAPGTLFAQSGANGGAPDLNPVKPGAVRITTRAPDTDKWVAFRSANGAQRIFKCKPLACSDAEIVTFTFSKSPTRHPNPKALEKFAKVDLPKSIRALDAAREILTDGAERVETVSSKTATLKNYPAVVNETKFTRGKTAAYAEIAIIFAGPAMVRVTSSSQNRELAQQTLNQFIGVMRIEEGPPPVSPAKPLPSGAQEL
jgi:hypothetical protein